MAGRISALDLFRKIPKDLTQATTHGGALTLLVFTVLSAVLILEVWTYAVGETRAKIVLDRNTDDKLQVNFAMTFFELPCQFAEVEMWDYLGNSKLDVSGQIEKNVVGGSHGQLIGKKYDGAKEGKDIVHAKSDGSHEILMSEFVFDATMENFGIKLKKHTYTLTLFYVDWCMFCKIIAPVWHELGKAVAQRGWGEHVAIARVDCVAEEKLCKDSKIPGYPTIMMFKDVHPLHDDYRGHRNVASLMSYIEKTADLKGDEDAKHPELKEQWHEGCLLRGRLEVNRVPGNFHISAKSAGHNFDQKSSKFCFAVNASICSIGRSFL